MKVSNTPAGDTLFNSMLEHGSLNAEISIDDRQSLHITHVQTDAGHLRKGIATTLITTTIRGAFAVEDNRLQTVEFQVISPKLVPLLGGVFDGSLVWYAEQEDKNAYSNPIDLKTAQTLATLREAQSKIFELNCTEFPDDFDPGVHAVVSLEPAQIAQWVMPNIVLVDKLF
jgi:hypothetical protein